MTAECRVGLPEFVFGLTVEFSWGKVKVDKLKFDCREWCEDSTWFEYEFTVVSSFLLDQQ